MTELPTTIFEVYEALVEIGRAWPIQTNVDGQEFLDQDYEQTSRWALWLGDATDAGSELDLAVDLGDATSRTETFSVQWAIVHSSDHTGRSPAELRSEAREHLRRLHALVAADPTLGGACSWCTVQVEFVAHGQTDEGPTLRTVGSFEVVSLVHA